MALTIKNVKIALSSFTCNLEKIPTTGEMTNANLNFCNSLYHPDFGVIPRNDTVLTMADIPKELITDLDRVMTAIYELQVHQQMLGTDTAVYPEFVEEPIVPPLAPLPPL